MEDPIRTNEAQAAAEPLPQAVAILKFIDRADGSMEIDASHTGEFEPMNQSHACLRAVIQFLPQICAPVGTRIDGNLGIKLPINDADRYQALRTLALIPETERDTILAHMDREPSTEAEFDAMADKIVELCRGLAGVPGTEKAPPVKLALVKSEIVG